jgi:hypothetical protein
LNVERRLALMRDLAEGGECGWISPSADRDVVEHYSLSRMSEEYERLFGTRVSR